MRVSAHLYRFRAKTALKLGRLKGYLGAFERSVVATRQEISEPSQRLLLCGYYGEHNLGDDALLEVLLAQLPAGCQATVTAHDGALVRQRFGVETVARRSLPLVLKALRHCDALVLGGGSLLQDSTSFKSLL